MATVGPGRSEQVRVELRVPAPIYDDLEGASMVLGLPIEQSILVLLSRSLGQLDCRGDLRIPNQTHGEMALDPVDSISAANLDSTAWRIQPDPEDQYASRTVPFNLGQIVGPTDLTLTTSMDRKLRAASGEARRAFVHVVSKISEILPEWKSTKEDFRFQRTGTATVVIFMQRRAVKFTIRTDLLGFSSSGNLFEPVPKSYGYPGKWLMAKVSTVEQASRIAEDVAQGIGE